MAKHIIREIRDQFDFYRILVDEAKNYLGTDVIVSKDGRNVNFLEERDDVVHSKVDDEIDLIFSVRKENHRYFQFKLRCNKLCGNPFFRFDSDGEAHRNHDESIPLGEQVVTTPHFHYVNESGIEMAYQPEVLKVGTETCEAYLNDINSCFELFSQHANLIIGKVEITIKEGLGMKQEEIDPTENVQF